WTTPSPWLVSPALLPTWTSPHRQAFGLCDSRTQGLKDQGPMCGIIGILSKTGSMNESMGQTVLTMLEALACRGPDSAGAAVIGLPELAEDDVWSVRIAPVEERPLERLARLGAFVEPAAGPIWERQGDTLRFRFRPAPGVTADDLERALGARRGGLEI